MAAHARARANLVTIATTLNGRSRSLNFQGWTSAPLASQRCRVGSLRLSLLGEGDVVTMLSWRSFCSSSSVSPYLRGKAHKSSLQHIKTLGTATPPVLVITDDVRAPAHDTRKYRALTLENGLQVLVVSDPQADVAASALTINRGTFHDPASRLGLAHFHEHMLFLGTERYPLEDEFSRFLGEYGGDSNAFTMAEHTTYHFKVASAHLEGALDRFAQFFVSPIFDASCVEREMRSVDSESTNYSTEDSWRLLNVLKSTAADAHPFSRFSIGNLLTLGADDLQAARSELVQWNREHYRADAMRLVIVGPQTVLELERLAVELFGTVPPRDDHDDANSSTLGGPSTGHIEPWPESSLGRLLRCVPLKDARAISVCWPLPPQSENLFTKPEIYLAHVLGHEGPGSLHDVLNQRGWVDQLSSGTVHSLSDAQLFAINIGLTPEGDANREVIIDLVYDYVNLVRETGPQEATFREIAALQEIAFAHKEDEVAQDDFASAASFALHNFTAKEALRGPFAMDEWRPHVIREHLDLLTPERCLIFMTSSAFEEEAAASLSAAPEAGAAPSEPSGMWRRERWYGAAFSEQPLGAQHLMRWRASGASGRAEVAGLLLPAPNRFIPRSFALRCDDEIAKATFEDNLERSRLPVEVTPPQLLRIGDGPSPRLWHKVDRAFRTPRALIFAHFHSLAYWAGPASVVTARLLCGLLADDLNNVAYDASVAGLSYSLQFTDNLTLAASGFSDRLPELVEVVACRLPELLAELEEAAVDRGGSHEQMFLERLEIQRHILLQDYNNMVREEPWSVCGYYSSLFMHRGSWHLSEYVEALQQDLCLRSFAVDARAALNRIQMEVFATGNITAEEAVGLARTLESTFQRLGSTALPEIQPREIVCLPAGTCTVFEYDLAADHHVQENSCTLNIYQVGPLGENLKRDACLDLVTHLASTSAYQQLRTEEQLGYSVQAGFWSEQHVGGLTVLVQGNRLPPHEVDARIESWLTCLGRELENVSDEEFGNNVSAVITGRTQRYASIAQEAGRHWMEIAPRQYQFDRLAKSVAALEALDKAAVTSFFHEFFSAEGSARRKFSVRGLGLGVVSGAASKRDQVVFLKSLEDLRAFQATTTSWPRAAEGLISAPKS
eukprot:TRINITY_DN12106_c1_g1_i1.p1 TRINITY_DN12106_c1_g1~~TRINITY_DN12106_c1_g1_i1.p1  ORF type:complete len:1135 (+),score=186.34 TRINITY_DN12106_c1_g1_i1:27-3407(+)